MKPAPCPRCKRACYAVTMRGGSTQLVDMPGRAMIHLDQAMENGRRVMVYPEHKCEVRK